MWANNGVDLRVGDEGYGWLNITGGGLVKIAGTLTLAYGEGGYGAVNIASGGNLALFGDADDSLAEFLGLITFGTYADFHYWDDSLGDWADIAGATLVANTTLIEDYSDYALTYCSGGDLDGYTILTVGVPNDPIILLAGDANRDGMVSAGDYASVQANFGNTGIAGIPGDANGDGMVSAGDYASVQANFGNTGIAGIPGDANGDGMVSAGDYASVQANFGNVTAASIPEPATLSLLAIGGVSMIRHRRKKGGWVVPEGRGVHPR